MCKFELVLWKLTAKGETLELRHCNGVWRLLWIESLPGRKSTIMDVMDYTSERAATARFYRAR